ncbi:MAG: enoyl-CoA hydratase/isomerase family protein [Xanthomonadales bacterium]|nr:enoyl-CoA hydratase/isomerase family protein [Gammaproteobacteria bacterium]MBT8051787.1 enoyl-CoA hydratase/isomerase family protein [Gammaproteobacteria bacterium]MBT8055363.1 enoyl-CoA hydratase/isomerase family protein [Gammaproteobacteria bacterium]NNJ79751.1 enoyl-CoA hydratase/isomerase family protein [Xanthomonadales bacterium]NNL04849.1 enoyl-CoA hydratase/isomerase family protein [Xanthomonadales bacterium]
MNYETIRYETEGPIAWISLNRPEKLNAINPEMVEELKHATDRAQVNDDVRVVVLKGEGRAFSAGLDLAPRVEQDPSSEEDMAQLKASLKNHFEMTLRFWDSPKPTIAAVHTYCIGAGFELALACDLTLAANDCRFGAPEVLYGSGVITMLLPYICGPKRAKEILLTGTDRISTQQAVDWGLVNRAVQEKNLVKRTRELALEIARNDRLAVQISKQAVNTAMEIGSMREALKHALELELAIETTETPASKEFDAILRTEGIRAALEWREEKLGHHGRVMRHEIG